MNGGHKKLKSKKMSCGPLPKGRKPWSPGTDRLREQPGFWGKPEGQKYRHERQRCRKMPRTRSRKGAMSQDMDKSHRWLNSAGKHKCLEPFMCKCTHTPTKHKLGSCTDDRSGLFCLAANWSWPKQKTKIQEEATISRTGMASDHRTAGDGAARRIQGGSDSRSPTQRPGQWAVLQFSRLSSSQRTMCKAGNTEIEKFLYT